MDKPGIVLRFSLVLFFLCVICLLFVDVKSAEFVILTLSAVFNAAVAAVSAIKIRKQK